jgi:hypothetical protein
VGFWRLSATRLRIVSYEIIFVVEEVVRYATMTKEGFITFDELLAVITEVELNAEYAD